jgi:shikimate kinase
MVVFLVGPSGAGKSTLLKLAAASLPNLRIYDLDVIDRVQGTEEWGTGWEERRWLRDTARLGEVSETDDLVVVDVGAGSLQTVAGRTYFRQQATQCIAILAPPEVVHRRKHSMRNLCELKATEYSQDRQVVYESAARKIHTERANKTQNAALLVQALLDLSGSSR